MTDRHSQWQKDRPKILYPDHSIWRHKQVVLKCIKYTLFHSHHKQCKSERQCMWHQCYWELIISNTSNINIIVALFKQFKYRVLLFSVQFHFLLNLVCLAWTIAEVDGGDSGAKCFASLLGSPSSKTIFLPIPTLSLIRFLYSISAISGT